jgi:hypothetical protein
MIGSRYGALFAPYYTASQFGKCPREGNVEVYEKSLEIGHLRVFPYPKEAELALFRGRRAASNGRLDVQSMADGGANRLRGRTRVWPF